MAAAVVTKKAYLLKKGEVYLQFVGRPPTRNSERVLLYNANLESFTCFQEETYDDQQIELVSEAIEKAAELGDNKPKIEMYGKYDTFYETPRIYTNVKFPQEFVKTLLGILQEPTISIRGTYKVVRQIRNVYHPTHFHPVGNVALPRRTPFIHTAHNHRNSYHQNVQELVHHMDAQEGHLRSPAVISRFLQGSSHWEEGPNTAYINWTPVDNQEVEFSVEGLELKENATYQGFNGIEKLGEYYNSGGITNAQLTYSVILEWKEFEGPNQGFEGSILDKLFEGKPLADCVLVASNKLEFECHRNILGANSEVLLRMLESGMQESQTKRIKMEDMSEKAVKMMLDYMYGRSLNLGERTEEEILELLKAAHKYNISRLELIISRFLLYKPVDWFTMDGVLALYFFAKNVDDLGNLVEKLKMVMKGNTQELSASATYKEWMEVEPQMAAQFVLQLLEPEERNENPFVGVQDGNEEHQIVDLVGDANEAGENETVRF